ncbi:UNVERIFIED_CONTAM: hypothetical protein PYX00_004814 [Menopon gallinae]|uniref:Uncharacterized protein n=1 Tax=Menopon gallinae TaxID=328185 RepID=A0AAW2I645_9NEOP
MPSTSTRSASASPDLREYEEIAEKFEKALERAKRPTTEPSKEMKESRSAEDDEPESEGMYDRVLTWLVSSTSQGETDESPRASGEMGARNSESDRNIFTFPSPERTADEMGKCTGVFGDYGDQQKRAEVLDQLLPTRPTARVHARMTMEHSLGVKKPTSRSPNGNWKRQHKSIIKRIRAQLMYWGKN